MPMLSHLALACALSSSQSPSFEWFRVRTTNGVSWFSQRNYPKFWSFAVDCVDMGGPGKPENPSYDAHRMFDSEKAWAEDTLKNLQSWGVNSLGAWSDYTLFNREIPVKKRPPYFVVLHLGAYDKAPWNDMFSPAGKKLMDDAAKKQIVPIRGDRLLVGYFTDNELGWWGDSLFPGYMNFDAKSPGKQRLVQVIREHYGNSFKAFQKDWKTDCRSFDDLLKPNKPKLIPGSDGIQVVRKWVYTLSRHYYQTMERLVRKYDKNHMILGDRYCQFFDLDVVNASRGLVDVNSTNLGSDWPDGTYSHFYLDTLYRVTKKPTVITEFYFAAKENNTGNRNSGDAFPKVETQAERAKGFAQCLKTFAERPHVIGAHWFQFYDEPPLGRGDGEDWNMGLMDIHGKPYPLMIDVAKKAQPTKVHAQKIKPVTPAIAQAPAEPMKDRLLHWNRAVGYVPSSSTNQWSDLYLSHDKENVYVGLLAMEYFDESMYESGKIPEIDRPHLKLSLNGKTYNFRFGGNKQAATSTPKVDMNEWYGLRPVIVAKIPLKSLNLKGKQIKIEGSLWTHGRGRKMTWNQRMALQ